VLASTVATLVVADDHVPPETVEANVVVPFEQIEAVPLKLPAIGAAVTVTVLVSVALAQPPVPTLVYVMVAVPAATPVIKPDEALIVAIEVAEDDQEPPVTVELNVVVNPVQTAWLPLNVPAVGAAVTVTVLV